MGWSAGSELAENIYLKVKKHIPEAERRNVAKYIYDSVCDLDADDWSGESQLEIDAGVNQEENE